MTVNIAIADATDLALEGIRAVLRDQPAFQVVGAYFCLAELLDALPQARPDVILLGDRLEPESDVLTVSERLLAAAPRARLIVLSTLADGHLVQELFAVGALAFLHKYDPLRHHLIEAIHTVIRGRPYLSPSANSAYLLAMQSGQNTPHLNAEAREVLRQMAQGLRPQEIALRRGVSVRRIYSVCEKLRRRFGAETNAQLIALAAEEGFLP